VTRILVFAGSIRTGSLSARLAAAAAKDLALADAEVTHISLADYPLPIYDGDLEANKGFPENVLKLARQIAAHDGIFIATPEYNHSLPPLLKNAIDWVSRPKVNAQIPLRGKIYGLGSSSNGLIGGARALMDLRKVLSTAVGAFVIPEHISLSRAQTMFNEAGALTEPLVDTQLKKVVAQLVETARKLGDPRR
jgi:NAD(P)H-dependent FMN reductase